MSITRTAVRGTYNTLVARPLSVSVEAYTKAATVGYFAYGLTLGQPANAAQFRTGITGRLDADFRIKDTDTRTTIVHMLGDNIIDIGGYFDDVADVSHIAWKANLRYAALFANWLGCHLADIENRTKADAWDNLALALQKYAECNDFQEYLVYMGNRPATRVGLKLSYVLQQLKNVEYLSGMEKEAEEKEKAYYASLVGPVFTDEMKAQMEKDMAAAFEGFIERLKQAEAAGSYIPEGYTSIPLDEV